MARKRFWTAWLGVALTAPAVAASGPTGKSHHRMPKTDMAVETLANDGIGTGRVIVRVKPGSRRAGMAGLAL